MSMEHDFSNDGGTSTKVAVGATSVEVVAAQSQRKYLLLVNDSNATIYVHLGTADAVINTGIRLNANGGALEISGERLYRGKITAISSAASKNLCVFYA